MTANLGFSEGDCRAILGPYHSILAALPHRALARLNSLPDRLPLMNHPTVFANALWGFVQDEAVSAFAGHNRVRIVESFRVKLFLFDNEVMLRVKLVDEAGAASNYPTQRAQAFNDQLDIDDIPSTAPRVDLGYRANAFRTLIAETSVIHRDGEQIAWGYAIQPAVERVQVLPMVADRSPRRRGAQRIRGVANERLKAQDGEE